MSTWGLDQPPLPAEPRPPASWLRVALRGLVIGTVTYTGLLILLLLRLIEWPLFGARRPITPWVTQGVCQIAVRVLGLRLEVVGRPMQGAGAFVANHTSWLDIFVLNALKRIYFVAKAEVAGWPGIGWLARATGTVFIARKSSEAAAQRALFIARLAAGHRLTFFPEGTSSDGLRVLPFKSTLFAAFFDLPAALALRIQPVSVAYLAPPGADPRLYGWWGEMSFGGNLIATLARAPQGTVRVTFHDAIAVAEMPNRKALAAACEAAVRQGLQDAGLSPDMARSSETETPASR